MASLNAIIGWFVSKAKPTASQFQQAWSSFWHKDDTIPMSSVGGLGTALGGKANSSQLATKADLVGGKVPLSQLPDSLGPGDIDEEAVQELIDASIENLKDGVPSEGDTLNKVWQRAVSAYAETSVANIAARNAYNVPSLPCNVFVTDDGDGKWALYKATSTGVGATYVKLSDQDTLHAVMTASQIKTAYESNSNTNAFTNSDKTNLDNNTFQVNNLVQDNVTVRIFKVSNYATL